MTKEIIKTAGAPAAIGPYSQAVKIGAIGQTIIVKFLAPLPAAERLMRVCAEEPVNLRGIAPLFEKLLQFPDLVPGELGLEVGLAGTWISAVGAAAKARDGRGAAVDFRARCTVPATEALAILVEHLILPVFLGRLLRPEHGRSLIARCRYELALATVGRFWETIRDRRLITKLRGDRRPQMHQITKEESGQGSRSSQCGSHDGFLISHPGRRANRLPVAPSSWQRRCRWSLI